MKKLYFSALFWMLAGLIAGGAVDMFLEARHFEGDTRLSVLHTHIFALGVLFMMVVLALEKLFELSKTRVFNLFFWSYTVGLVLMCVATIRIGLGQVAGNEPGEMWRGLSGLGHVAITAGLGLLFVSLYQRLLTDYNKQK